MKKGIIVNKCKGHRVFIDVFSVVAVAAITICVVCLNMPVALLLHLPILLIVVPMVLYYSTWQLHFEEQYILKRVFFRDTKKYSYTQLREVTRRYYTSGNNFCVIMYFSDGTRIKFRMDDDGAAQAVKELQRHRSIKTE